MWLYVQLWECGRPRPNSKWMLSSRDQCPFLQTSPLRSQALEDLLAKRGSQCQLVPLLRQTRSLTILQGLNDLTDYELPTTVCCSWKYCEDCHRIHPHDYPRKAVWSPRISVERKYLRVASERPDQNPGLCGSGHPAPCSPPVSILSICTPHTAFSFSCVSLHSTAMGARTFNSKD